MKGAWLYAYEDGIYHSPSPSIMNQEVCMSPFTFKEGGPNIPIGGRWCITLFSDDVSIYGYQAFKFVNTSPYSIDVFMFMVSRDPNYCPQCIPGKPPSG